jgi:hypothetical protein
MSEELRELIERAGKIEMAPVEKEHQRRSFAWGNTHFENERITKDTVREAAESLEKLDEPAD